MQKKFAILIIVGIDVFILTVVVILGFKAWQVHSAKEAFVPQETNYKMDVPSQSLTGTVISPFGTVERIPRTSEEYKIILENDQILEAEKIKTNSDGSVKINFPTNIFITINPQTELTFLSTSPANFLVKQDKGVVIYQTDDATKSISVRALHALMSVNNGAASVTVDPEDNEIVFQVTDGSGVFGYIDTDNKTQTVEVTENTTLTFNDEARTRELN